MPEVCGEGLRPRARTQCLCLARLRCPGEGSPGRVHWFLPVSLLALGLLSITYLPIVHFTSRQGDPRPGQTQPVLFHSPDCDECRQAKPYAEAIVSSQDWLQPALVDANVLKNDALRVRFDAAFQVPDNLRWHVPALFHEDGYVIGLQSFEAVSANGLPPSNPPTETDASGFPWTRWAEFALAGLSLASLAWLLGTGSQRAESAALALLAVVFLVSGISKLLSPAGFTEQVARMPMIPESVAQWAWLTGVGELALVAGLLSAKYRPMAICTTTMMLVGFSGLVLWLMVAGYEGSCGCFPWRDHVGWWTLARDLGLLALAVALLRVRQHGIVRADTHPGKSARHAAEPAVTVMRSDLL